MPEHIPDFRDRLKAVETQMEYIQRGLDRVEATNIKHIHDLREQNRGQEVRIRFLERSIWMGIGAIGVLQVVNMIVTLTKMIK